MKLSLTVLALVVTGAMGFDLNTVVIWVEALRMDDRPIAAAAGGITLLIYAYFLFGKKDDGLGEGHTAWENDHCSCFMGRNCQVCLLGCCCPCMQWAVNVSELKLMGYFHAVCLYLFCILFPTLFGEVGRFFKWGMRDETSLYAQMFLVISQFCYLALTYSLYSYRRKIIGLYQIRERDACSFWWVCLCPCLSTCQEGRHIEARGPVVGEPLSLNKAEYDEEDYEE